MLNPQRCVAQGQVAVIVAGSVLNFVDLRNEANNQPKGSSHSSASFWLFQKLPKGVLVVVEPLI